MNPELFIIWLQGFLTACGGQPNTEQSAMIQAKIDTVQMRGMFRDRPEGSRSLVQDKKAE